MEFVHYFTKVSKVMRYDEHFLCDSSGKTIIKSYHSAVSSGTRQYQAHHHTECELSLFLKGRGIYRVGEKFYTFAPGDMFLFGSNEVHCITDIDEELDLLNIQFEPQFLWERTENIELLSLFVSRNKNFSNKFDSSDIQLRDSILSTATELSKSSPAHDVAARCFLLLSLTHILRNYDYTNPTSGLTTNDTTLEKLRCAMEYIDNNIEKELTLSDIAKRAFMSQNYFSSVFKKYNGISPWEYITIKRVERAVLFLRTTSLTKLEIAEKCGFSSSSNFYKAFEKITGKTPTDFTSQKQIPPKI